MRVAFYKDGVCTHVLNCAEGWEDLFPDETGIASETANAGDTWDGASFISPPLPPPGIGDVLAERDRRLSLGFSYDFGDARGVHQIGTTSADMTGWDEVTKVAQAMIATGAATATIEIITDTGPATVTASEWMAILLAAGAHRQPIWQASFVLQAMSPVPADYAADSRWA